MRSVDTGRLVAIDHVAEDEAFCGHPTPKMYGFQSYISVPIRLNDGQFFGTLCGIDPRPRRVSAPETIAMFELFAKLIAFHIEGEQRLEVSETALFDERQRTNLQDQFVAVLGHDLRNPLSAIQTGARTLLVMPNAERVVNIARVIDRSASRMTRLIEDVLDFARGPLGRRHRRESDPRQRSSGDAAARRGRDEEPGNPIVSFTPRLRSPNRSSATAPASVSCCPISSGTRSRTAIRAVRSGSGRGRQRRHSSSPSPTRPPDPA